MGSRQFDADFNPQGTYLNTGEAARRAYRFNRFCYDLRLPANREAFTADPDALMERYKLSEEERRMVHERDWLGLVRNGANVFVLLRLSNLVGDGLSATGARMRGETLEQYLASRAKPEGR